MASHTQSNTISKIDNTHHHDTQGDTDIVAIWLRRAPVRWFAGALAGAFAGLVAMAFAAAMAKANGYEVLYPVKVAALPWLGASALDFGNTSAVICGLASHEVLCMILGAIYAHFTGSNFLPTLFGMGLTWGAFSWIFINNLFSKSDLNVRATNLPAGYAFFFWMIFGVSLTSVAFFDRALRGNRPSNGTH